MEIVAPIAFLVGLSAPLTTSPLSSSTITLAASWQHAGLLLEPFHHLPRARLILAVAFLIHYANRSLVSTWRNPSRAKMHLAVPLSAILFNGANGFTLGMFIGGGFVAVTESERRDFDDDGLAREPWARALFWTGMTIWALGLASNIYHDEVLYSLKRQSQPRESRRGSKPTSPSPSGAATTSKGRSQRYSIPPRSKGLYRFVSHPSYLSEWLEWLGYHLASLSLGPAPFPSFAATLLLRAGGGKRPVPLPQALQPWRDWYLQPTALFVLMEVAIMWPRATSGHRWYERTFGRKEWQAHGQRWVVIPGVW
jgi:3-oxo-5-alpha-steroid 4-dehydrogenase 1